MSNAPRDARAKRDWGSDDSATPILNVDMDSFFAQVEMREDPRLIGSCPGRARRHADLSRSCTVPECRLDSGQLRCLSAIFPRGHEDSGYRYSRPGAGFD